MNKLSPTSRPAETEQVIVHLDNFGPDVISGWAYNIKDMNTPSAIDIFIDETFVSEVICENERPDVLANGHFTSRVGFSLNIPTQYYDDLAHTLELRGKADGALISGSERFSSKFKTQVQLKRFAFNGQVDGFRDGAI